MVDKEGTDGEEEAKKAYKAAKEDSDQAVERALGDKVSSALIDRVRLLSENSCSSTMSICINHLRSCHLLHEFWIYYLQLFINIVYFYSQF